MKNNRNKKICWLTFLFLVLFLGVLSPQKADAVDDFYICNLKTEAPVGKLAYLIVDLNIRLLEQTEIISKQAFLASKSARDLIKLKDTCNPRRCNSSCEIEQTGFTPCNIACKSGYTCDPTNYFPTGSSLVTGVLNCASMTGFNPDDEATYAEFKWTRASNGNTGKCYNPACNDSTCNAEECKGEACDFDKIKQSVNRISAAKDKIDKAYKKITDFFELKIKELPMFGEPCLPPFMTGYNCSQCEIRGIAPERLNTCSEVGYLFKITDQTSNNLRSCDSGGDLNDLGEGGSIETLLRCQDALFYLVDDCYKDNFFCCLLK